MPTSIFCLGQPLLDIIAEVDPSVLERYGLKLNDMILAGEAHMPVFAEVAATPGAKYIAGGAEQNSARAAQWMLQEPGATVYSGCIGNDDFGAKMRSACAQDGVQADYMVDEALPTGLCAVLVVKPERSLCSRLEASNSYKPEFMRRPETWRLVEEAKVLFTSAYMVTTSLESMRLLAEEAARRGVAFCLNLAAPFLMKVPPLKAGLKEVLPYVTHLFGNLVEAETWAESEGWDTKDPVEIAKRLALIPSAAPEDPDKPLGCSGRTVIITRGSEPTVVVYRGTSMLQPVVAVPQERLVDTNAAGDAYAGGFLAGLVKGQPLEGCCAAGAYAASVVVQHNGCSFPERPDFKW